MKISLLFLLLSTFVFAANECIVCHKGIEHIREESSGMTKAILEVADKAGHAGNDCIVCHGGNPTGISTKKAHKGTVEYFKSNKGPKEFYPAPGSAWVNQNTCGMCHPEQVNAQMNSLMMTKSGKIQGALWSFGGKNGYNHDVGNYPTKNPQDPHTRLGTQKYKEYMNKLSLMEPQAFPKEMKELPTAPTADEVEKDPSLAVYTYLRQEHLRSHTGSKGKEERGDYRGSGCAACHIPYSSEGYYEGSDKSIKQEKGHLRVHSIQSSRDAKVQLHNGTYSGVPVETCAACHNRGDGIGLSYQGLMESDSKGPFDDEGNEQQKLHSKHYMHMKEDIHFKKGMLCQDCHTSNDLHGDGFLSGANLAAVEVECQDCHGTTKSYPWELPLGYSDEFNTSAAMGKPRGTMKTMAEYLKTGSVNEPKDGYLITARGNPLIHAVKEGEEIMMHLASGKDVKLTPLKKLKENKKLSKVALVAMDSIRAHNDKLECYTCHTSWAPQHYGSQVKIDYSQGKQNPDYLKSGDKKDLKHYLADGQVSESQSFIRWEELPLSQNGEGRVSPTIAGFQTVITVVGKEGTTLLKNHIYKIPHVEGAGAKGQNAIDMSPVQPHTISKESRSCESCHTSKKAMGMGIGGLREDYSQFLDENGTQMQTVGTHFKLSGPLSKDQRDKLERSGVCLSCHQELPNASLALSAMTHMAQMAEINIDNATHQSIVKKSLNLSAWFQVLGAIFVGMLIMLGIYMKFIKKRPINPKNEGWK